MLTDHDARVRLALGFDYYFLSQDAVTNVFAKAHKVGIDLVTSHCARTPGDKSTSLPGLLKAYGLLDHRILLSHLGGATQADVELLRKAKAFIAASPSSEMTMGLGPPCCFRHDLPGIDDVCSLGTDCHCTTSSSMVNEMRVGLLAARGNHAADSMRRGSLPTVVHRSSQDAFTMATIQGARALNMDNEIGSIAVGKKADLAVFDGLTPAMTAAAQQDPVKAIVMHSSVNDVKTVIIDGVIRKRDGSLLPIQLIDWKEDYGEFEHGHERVGWDRIAREVLTVREKFASRLPDFDINRLAAFVRDLYRL